MKLSLLFFFLALAFLGSVIPSFAEAATLSRPANNLGLRGYWSFDEGAGLRASDYSGLGNNGTLSGAVYPAWVAGKFGKGLKLSDSGSQVNVGSSASLAVTSAFTYSIWLKRDGLSTYQWPYVMYSSDTHRYYGLRSLAYGDYIAFEYGTSPYSGATYTHLGCGGTGNLPVGEWRLFTVTYDGSNLTCYRNGAQISIATGVAINPASPTTLNFSASGVTFNGYIDDARVYARALSATEVAGLFTERGQVIAKMVPRSGLIGEWLFNEGTSTQARDTSGKANNGSLTNSPVWTVGKHGKGLTFDGSSSYVTGTGTNLPNTGASANITISAWVNPATVSGSRAIFSKGASASCFNYGMVLVNGVLRARNTNLDYAVASVALPTNKWSFVTIVYTGAGAQGYINGVSSGTNASGVTTSCGTTNWTIGDRASNALSEFFSGPIDGVRVYNRALSLTEIQALYTEQAVTINSSKNGKMTNGLVGLWSFDGADVQTTTAYDRSGNGNNGTLTSSPRPTIGKIGQALSFDGAATYISMSNPASLQLSQGTVSAWIKTSNAGTSYRGIVSKASAYGMYLQSNIFGVYDNGTPAFRTTGVNLADNKWHHVSFSFDSGVTNGTLLYIDGALVLTTTLTNTAQTSSLQVGRGQGGASQIFNGAIDDVRVYNRILPASEIKQLYNMGK